MARFHATGRPGLLERRALRAARAQDKAPTGEAYIVREDFDDIPRVHKIVITSRSDKQVRVVMSPASNHRSNFEPVIFDRFYLPTREAAIAYWRKYTQNAIEANTREINRLRKLLAAEPKDAKR